MLLPRAYQQRRDYRDVQHSTMGVASRQKMRIVVLLVGVSACSALPVSALIRSPIDSKCQSYGLKGCPELVDGAIAYTEGNKPVAIQKLEAARSLNTPQQLKQFAAALRTIGEASPDAGRPLLEVAAILTGGAKSVTEDNTEPSTAAAPTVSASASPTSQPTARIVVSEPVVERRGAGGNQLALLALTARDDPMRQVAETVLVAQAPGVDCQIAGNAARCARRRQGPLIVTDIVASEECGSRVFVAAADSDTPGFGFLWLAPARVAGIHGGHFTVGGGQWLFVGVKPPNKPLPGDQACFVTWWGFKPRLVPGAASEDYTLGPEVPR